MRKKGFRNMGQMEEKGGKRGVAIILTGSQMGGYLAMTLV